MRALAELIFLVQRKLIYLALNWVNLDPDEEKRDRFDADANLTSTPPKQLVEAQGWVLIPMVR